jgi:hypothetical protein
LVEATKSTKPWFLARSEDFEVLTNASVGQARDLVAGLVRGQRLIPDFLRRAGPTLVRLIVVDEPGVRSNLTPLTANPSSARVWDEKVESYRGGVAIVDSAAITVALNLGSITGRWPIWTALVSRQLYMQEPSLPAWCYAGLFGECGAFSHVTGVPNSTTVMFAGLPWPDEPRAGDSFALRTGLLPEFAVMFAATRDPAKMTEPERRLFAFQTGLFVRWSLFGPAKNGRDRNAFWAFAEMARRGSASEEVFRQCYGMDWAQARRELRAYLNSKGMGVLEARMPAVMAPVPEAEHLQFREATREEVKLILGDFNRARRISDTLAAQLRPNQFRGNSARKNNNRHERNDID